MDLFGRQNADARASRIALKRELSDKKSRLEYELVDVSNQLENNKRRLRDLECASRAQVVPKAGSEWNSNVFNRFVNNLDENIGQIKDTCNQLNMKRMELHREIQEMQQKMSSLSIE